MYIPNEFYKAMTRQFFLECDMHDIEIIQTCDPTRDRLWIIARQNDKSFRIRIPYWIMLKYSLWDFIKALKIVLSYLFKIKEW